MTIRHTSLPTTSVLIQSGKVYDYVDGFQTVIGDPNRSLRIEDVGQAFFSSGPAWVGGLFALRNKLVAPFGLKTSGLAHHRRETLDRFKCEPGQQLGLFRVFAKTESEVVLGEDDAHLNFRVSLILGDPQPLAMRTLTLSTVVEYRNWLGRLYFIPVRLFHRLIVPAMLKGMAQQLEKSIREN